MSPDQGDIWYPRLESTLATREVHHFFSNTTPQFGRLRPLPKNCSDKKSRLLPDEKAYVLGTQPDFPLTQSRRELLLLENNTPGRVDFPGCPGYPQRCAWTGIALPWTKPCHFCCEPLVAGTTTWSRKLEGESAVLCGLCDVFQDRFIFILLLVQDRTIPVHAQC